MSTSTSSSPHLGLYPPSPRQSQLSGASGRGLLHSTLAKISSSSVPGTDAKTGGSNDSALGVDCGSGSGAPPQGQGQGEGSSVAETQTENPSAARASGVEAADDAAAPGVGGHAPLAQR